MWSDTGAVAAPLTKELLQSAFVRAEQAIVMPDRIIVHPKQYTPLVIMLTCGWWSDDVLPRKRRRLSTWAKLWCSHPFVGG